MDSPTVEPETLAILASLLTDTGQRVERLAEKNVTAMAAADHGELASLLHALDEAIGHVRHVFALPQHVDVIAPTDMSEQTPFPQ